MWHSHFSRKLGYEFRGLSVYNPQKFSPNVAIRMPLARPHLVLRVTHDEEDSSNFVSSCRLQTLWLLHMRDSDPVTINRPSWWYLRSEKCIKQKDQALLLAEISKYQLIHKITMEIYGGWIVSKSTVTVLEEGNFTEEGGGFNWRGCFSFMEKECV